MGRGAVQKRSKSRTEATAYPYWFGAPATLIFTVFFVLPAALGLWLSFTNASTMSQRQDFIGLANFELLFGTHGEAFLGAMGNQFLYALITTIGKTGIGVLLAFFLNRAFLGRNVLRAIVYMPIMFSTIVVGIVFGFILSYEGLLNSFLRSAGLGFIAKDWLGDFDLALFSVTAIDIWMGVGWTVVLVLAALQGVPAELLESAEVDGAGRFARAIHVSLPTVAPTISLAALLTLISGLKSFEIIYATTGGGPGNATEVMTTFLAKALGTTNLGYASAISFVQFAVITVIAMIIHLISRRIEARMS
ncbi:sugar ABC transporter permease [Microbacterium sp.]|uniref:carbohydrate ABC transporter permease n=1 Tax=Microbacterium sp. TaxID=51671 RepID=UPI0028ACAD7C|nr:sugar ABC transporter permease [Microbacterium sp.]